jgi:hypothetical protein
MVHCTKLFSNLRLYLAPFLENFAEINQSPNTAFRL